MAKVAPSIATLDVFLEKYSLTPAKRNAKTIEISTPTSERKEAPTKVNNIAALRELSAKHEREKNGIDEKNKSLLKQLKESTDNKELEAIMKQITQLNAAGRIAELTKIIKEIKDVLHKLEPTDSTNTAANNQPPPLPPKKNKTDSRPVPPNSNIGKGKQTESTTSSPMLFKPSQPAIGGTQTNNNKNADLKGKKESPILKK